MGVVVTHICAVLWIGLHVLKVRGPLIAMYARRIASWMDELPEDVRGVFDENAAALWEAAGDAVPQALVDTSVAASSPEELTTLTQAFKSDREGYAHTRFGAPEERAANIPDDLPRQAPPPTTTATTPSDVPCDGAHDAGMEAEVAEVEAARHAHDSDY